LGDLSNFGVAVRRYSEGRSTGPQRRLQEKSCRNI
jgi:hypothetical protein